jgi:hypothetical protein
MQLNAGDLYKGSQGAQRKIGKNQLLLSKADCFPQEKLGLRSEEMLSFQHLFFIIVFIRIY